jgi:hypothetical protein
MINQALPILDTAHVKWLNSKDLLAIENAMAEVYYSKRVSATQDAQLETIGVYSVLTLLESLFAERLTQRVH